MRALETTVWSLLLLSALSMAQTDAFAFGGHRGHRGDFTAMEPRTDDGSKYHTVLKHPEEGTSGFATSNSLQQRGPEIVTLNGAHGIVHEDDVSAVHPESKTQKKQEPKSAKECTSVKPYGC